MKKFCKDNPVERLGYQKDGILDIKKHKWFQVTIYLSPLNSKRGVGGEFANWESKRYFSGTECRIDLKPGCKSKFFCCFEVNVKTISIETLKGPEEVLLMAS